MKSNLPSISRNMLLSFLTLVLLLSALPWAISAQADPLDDIEGVSATYAAQGGYVVVDTGQTTCYDNTSQITCPQSGEAFYGQDAQYDGNQPSYTLSADGLTVYDNVTGLTWTQGADWTGDGTVDASDKFSYADAQTYVDTLNAQDYGGHDDWRVPTIKELYSLIDYRGTDPDPTATSTSDLVPFIDDSVFEFAYGDTSAGERTIDSQWATSTLYVSTVMGDTTAMFGVNFADGRIKGYPASNPYGGAGKTYYVRFCRGNTDYGTNTFTDNGDQSVTDSATGLMWSQSDNGAGVNWENALSYAENSTLGGYDDWRLPNAKELQSLVDYTRSPDTHGTAAIDPIFSATGITNEAGESDYPFYWSGTTFLRFDGSASKAVYVAFGEGLGTMDGTTIIDVHGAGCQRSDPKDGDPNDYPRWGNGPQGDVARVFNYVRLVRDADTAGQNVAPTAEAGGPYAGQPDGSITLDGSASSDTDGSIVSYAWDLDDDGDYDDATGETTSFTASTAGSYTVGLKVTDDDGAEGTDTATVVVSEPTAAFEGYNLFSSLNSTTTYLMDNDGNFVHSWATDYRPGASVYFLENGELLHTGTVNNSTFDGGGAGGIVQTIDWDGNVTWEYEYSSAEHYQHHDVEMLPNGNVLMIAWQMKTEAEALAAGRDSSLLTDGELWPDSVIEIEPTGSSGGNIVWEWHAWDHLVQDYDSGQSNYGVVADHPELIDLNYAMNGGADWHHINSVDYNAELDQIVLSVHNFSEIWVIDHSTTTAEAAGHTGGDSGMGGDLLYRWGNPQTYDAGASTDQQLFVQHDAEWIEDGLPGEGNILIFNNGRGRPEGNYSSIEEIVTPVNPDGSYTLASGSDYGPDDSLWTYTADTPTDFYSQNISGQQRLANGNTLICEGANSFFFEVTAAGETVWEYDYTGAVFRVERYAPGYPGFDGTPLDDGSTNQAPVAEAGGPYVGNVGTPITLDGSGSSDTDGAIVLYEWDLDNDGQYDDATGSTTAFDAVNSGAFTVGLRVTDDDGATDTDAATITVSELPNVAPTADAGGPYSGTEGDTITLDGSGSIDTDGTIVLYEWDLDNDGQYDDATGATASFNAVAVGTFTIGLQVTDNDGASDTDTATVTVTDGAVVVDVSYAIVDTGQTYCYDDSGNVIDPTAVDAFYGQDAQHDGNQPSYITNADGLTVVDNVTGLTWTQSPDWDGDGDIDTNDKFTWGDAKSYVDTLNTQNYGGYSDWRLPSIKELYSLIAFDGETGMTAATSVPYVDTDYFALAYGDEAAGERHIDAQYWSSTEYVSTTMGGMHTVFGVNFADGRIKGYGTSNPMGGEMSQYVRYVRGDLDYGINDFAANGDGTVTDNATGLTWAQDDSGVGMDWEAALAWVQQMNDQNYLGHNDWRLPNAKELQSIVDYTRSPDTTGSAAIDPIFNVSTITDDGGQTDYPFFWTSTTHLDGPPELLGNYAVYVAFGEAEGWMEEPPNSGIYVLQDVHGAGAQRSDPKSGDPDDYPYGHGPQGDVIRIYNYVRLVRDVGQSSLPGDINGDCVVDIVDIMLVAVRWGTHIGDANYDPYYDLDHDGDIDILDIMQVAAQRGETCD